MALSEGRARSARATGWVFLFTGLGVMVMAPLARSQTPGPIAGASPAAPSPTSVAASAREEAAPVAAGWVDAEDALGKAFVYPPASGPGAARPVTVMLHGMCGHPQSACSPFVDVATSRGWLVCPRGEDACGGGTRWRLRGRDDAKLVEASVAAVASGHEGQVDLSAPRVIAGFSLGGIAAVQIAQASTSTYVGLVVIASQVHPDAAALRKAGIQRVVLAAGDLDITSAPLQKDAQSLAAQGIPTRFVSLGKFGHGYPADMEERMREPMAWVAGEAGGS